MLLPLLFLVSLPIIVKLTERREEFILRLRWIF